MKRGIGLLTGLILSGLAAGAQGQGAATGALGAAPLPKVATPPATPTVKPGTDAGSAERRAALAAAVAAGDVKAVMALGGSAVDVANAYGRTHASLAEFIGCGVTESHFVETGGRLGVTLSSAAPPPAGMTVRGATSVTQVATF